MVPVYLPSYWLTLEPAVVTGGIGQVIFLCFLVVFTIGIVARITGPARMPDRFAKRLVKQVGTALVIMGALGVILYFFSYENVRLFGARIWYPVWLIGLVSWLGYYAWTAKKKIPLLRASQTARKEINAYLPKKKK